MRKHDEIEVRLLFEYFEISKISQKAILAWIASYQYGLDAYELIRSEIALTSELTERSHAAFRILNEILREQGGTEGAK